MALNFPTSPTNSQQYTDDNGIVWEYISSKGVWDRVGSNSIKQFSGAKILFDVEKNLTSTLTACNFDTSEFDTDEYFDSVSFPSRLRIKRSGFYRVNILISVGSEGTGASYIFSVKLNGTNTLTNETAGSNQYVSYDETLQLYAGDYIELFASEGSSVGTLNTDSFMEIERIGFSIGSSASRGNEFSGVKLKLTTNENFTNIPTPLEWDTTEYNINADINANLYWNSSDAGKITIWTNGYYRLKSIFITENLGSSNSHLIDLRKDGITFLSSSMGANDVMQLDETYNLLSGSYFEVYISDDESIGEISTDSYIQLIRLGV
jgi:hypothetical protein